MVCRLIILQDTYLRIIMDYNLMLTLSCEETLQVITMHPFQFSKHYVSTNEHTVYRCVYSNMFIITLYLFSVLCLQSPGAIQ